ncbi:capsid staple protein [Solidesulfovibrio sp.]
MKKLASMELTKAERKHESGLAPAAVDEKRQFPWGLSVNLDDTSLKKLGRKVGDFTAGGYVFLLCKAKVNRIGIEEEEGGSEGRVALQIEAMDLQTEDDKAAAAFQKVYGHGD